MHTDMGSHSAHSGLSAETEEYLHKGNLREGEVRIIELYYYKHRVLPRVLACRVFRII